MSNAAHQHVTSASGVDYDPLDAFKRMAQEAAEATQVGDPLRRLGFKVVPGTRGESAFLFTPTRRDRYNLSHVEEGLGTKNLVSDALYELAGNSMGQRVIAKDAVAMIINDMATLGTFPLGVAMHLAVGSSRWFTKKARARALVEGWRDACIEARCVWSGGETPALQDLVNPESFVLSGSAVGVTKPKRKSMHPARVRAGDAIMVAPSTGIHANGLTKCREIVKILPRGYDQPIFEGGPAFGEAILQPTPLYSVLIENLLDAGVDVHYAVNITGHGWLKFMRAPQAFDYEISLPFPVPPIFPFIAERAKIEPRKMFAGFNMGVGYGVFVNPRDVVKAVEAGKRFDLAYGGSVSKPSAEGELAIFGYRAGEPQSALFYKKKELNIR